MPCWTNTAWAVFGNALLLLLITKRPQSLLHFLRDQGQPQSEWLNALSADQTLSEPVRQRALQFAREWK